MAAYPTNEFSSSSLKGFIPEEGSYPAVPYWYISSAPLSQEETGCMVCIGGPEYTLYSPPTSEEINEQAKDSLHLMREWVNNLPPPSPPFFWHGTMAYTQNGMRWVGEDPDHPHLWYNLGCNGIGILPALTGGQKIAKQLNREIFKSSLFDPPKNDLKPQKTKELDVIQTKK